MHNNLMKTFWSIKKKSPVYGQAVDLWSNITCIAIVLKNFHTFSAKLFSVCVLKRLMNKMQVYGNVETMVIMLAHKSSALLSLTSAVCIGIGAIVNRAKVHMTKKKWVSF